MFLPAIFAKLKCHKVYKTKLDIDFNALDQNGNAFHVLRRELANYDSALDLGPNFDLASLSQQLPDGVVINFCTTAPGLALVPINTVLSLRKSRPNPESCSKGG